MIIDETLIGASAINAADADNSPADPKMQTVIDKNTFYFFNEKFEQKYEGYIHLMKNLLLSTRNRINEEGLNKGIFEDLLLNGERGLRALLALTGVSNETLKRITTIIRVTENEALNNLVNKNSWCNDEDISNFREFSDQKICKLITENEHFRKGIVNVFFEGSTIPFLLKKIPLFELKKLSLSKLEFDISEMIDTLVRYKEKGSYSGQKENNPEVAIENILESMDIHSETGDLNELAKNSQDIKRTMDFIIPNKGNPVVIIECSFLATTSSGQGDKAKTEISIRDLIKKHYPTAMFFGFVDGIGWYVRRGDLARMVSAYDDVFTFYPDELKRFQCRLTELLPNEG